LLLAIIHSVNKMALKNEVYTLLAALITAAFGLIAALAWNGAIQAIFKQVFGSIDSVPAQLSYAIIVTIIAVIATILIARAVAHAKGEDVKKEEKTP
jgi:TRAP-type C4-dicarboxylate transport system permease small subunit